MKTFAFAAALILAAGTAFAADPVEGLWKTKPDDNGNFSIDAEAAGASEFVDYYSADPSWIFGVSPKVNSALQKRGLYAEWVNPGRLAVYGA